MNVKIKHLCKKLKEGNNNKYGQSYVPNPYIDFITFAEWMTKNGKRNRSIELNLKTIHKFDAEINEKNISTWMNHIRMKKQDAEAIQRMNYTVWNALTMYLEAIDKKEYISLLPVTKKVTKPASDAVNKDITSADWDIIVDGCKDEMIHDAMLVMRNIGLRVGEIIYMKKKWFQTKKDSTGINRVMMTIPKNISKNRKTDEVPIDEKTYNIIEKWLKGIIGDDYVFATKILDTKDDEKYKQKQLTYNDFFKVYRKIEKESDIKHIYSHKIRHAFCHDMERKKLILSELQVLMRHSSPVTTGRYIQQDKEATHQKFFEIRGDKVIKKKKQSRD